MRKLFLSTAILLGLNTPSMAIEYNNFRQGCHSEAWIVEQVKNQNMTISLIKAPIDVKVFLSRLDVFNNSSPDDLLTGDEIYFVTRQDGQGINIAIIQNGNTCGIWTASQEEFDKLIKDIRPERG